VYKILGFIKWISSDFKLFSPHEGSLLFLSASLVQIWFNLVGSPHSLRLCNHWACPKALLFLCRPCIEYPHSLHDYSPFFYELGLSTLTDRRVVINFKFLQDFIDGFADAPTLLSLINFRAPPRLIHYTTAFAVPMRTTNYGSNINSSHNAPY